MTRYCGLDLSPDGTAITIWEDNTLENLLLFSKVQKWEKKFPHHFVTTPKVTKANEQERIERLDFVSGEVLDFILSNDVAYVCLEDYAYGKVSSSAYQIAELGGQIRLGLYRHVKIRTFDPMSLKLYWAGNGHASKWDMHEARKTDPIKVNDSLGTVFMGVRDDYLHKYEEKKPTTPTGHPYEGLVDSIALATLLWEELQYREGKFTLVDKGDENLTRVFNRVTKNIPVCLVDRKFLTKVK